MMEKINILVTGAGGIGHGSSIVRALMHSALPLRIIAADMNDRLIHTAPVSDTEIIPSANSDDYISSVIDICEKYSVNGVFTGSEPELMRMSEQRREIERRGIRVFLNNHSVIEICKNKLNCMQFLEKSGFDIPQTVLLDPDASLDQIVHFPVVIKPYLETGASSNIYIAVDYAELKMISTYLFSRGLDIIAQEYIPFAENEYTVGVTSDMDTGKVINSIAMRKFMEGVTKLIEFSDTVISSGITQGEFLEFDIITSTCRKIAEKLGSTGPLNIQLRAYRGKILPFEINPRFSGTSSARAYAGYNEPEYFIRRYILNESSPERILQLENPGFVVKGLDERYVKYEK